MFQTHFNKQKKTKEHCPSITTKCKFNSNHYKHTEFLTSDKTEQQKYAPFHD